MSDYEEDYEDDFDDDETTRSTSRGNAAGARSASHDPWLEIGDEPSTPSSRGRGHLAPSGDNAYSAATGSNSSFSSSQQVHTAASPGNQGAETHADTTSSLSSAGSYVDSTQVDDGQSTLPKPLQGVPAPPPPPPNFCPSSVPRPNVTMSTSDTGNRTEVPTRDVSGNRRHSLPEGMQGQQAIHQSNYTTVTQLHDNIPLPDARNQPQRGPGAVHPAASASELTELDHSTDYAQWGNTAKSAASLLPSAAHTPPTNLPSAVRRATQSPSSSERATAGRRAKTDMSSTSSSHSSSSRRDREDADAQNSNEEERVALSLRVMGLRAEIATWDRRIARQRAIIAGTKAPGSAPQLPPSRISRRAAEAAQTPPRRRPSQKPPVPAPGPASGRKRGSSSPPANGRHPSSAPRRKSSVSRSTGNSRNAAQSTNRFGALKAENQRLEQLYTRRRTVDEGAAVISVADMVQQAEKQFQAAQARLKEVNAAKRLLTNRDKRAAHTIEAVHRNMPSKQQMREREMNEGLYARTALQQAVKELKETLERTKASTKFMETRSTELAKQLKERHLSSIFPKEYETLRTTREAQVKAAERYRNGITVYSAIFASKQRVGAVDSAAHGAPGKSADMIEQATNALLIEQEPELYARKQELQQQIADILQKMATQDAQIRTNLEAVAANPPSARGGGGRSRSPTPPLAQPPSRGSSRDGGGGTRHNRPPLPQTRIGGRNSPPPGAFLASAGTPTAGGISSATQGSRKLSDSNSLPLSTGTGKRTVREERQPASSSLRVLSKSPLRGGHGGNRDVLVELSESRQGTGGAMDEDDDDGVEAMLRKIDEENRRIGASALLLKADSPPVDEAAVATGVVSSDGEVLEDEVEMQEGSGRSTPVWLRSK